MLFFSNQVEVLVEQLKRNLFVGTGPFSKRLLVVPSRLMEEWIRLQLAEDPRLQVACGFQSTFLQRAVGQFSHPLPLTLELVLRLEEEVSQILERPTSLWDPVVRYLGSKPRRLLPFCQELARLFPLYGLYGKALPEDHWQMVLWRRVFSKTDFVFHVEQDVPDDVSIHLFTFSHIPLPFFRLFLELPVTFYHLSPTREFWSDLAVEEYPLLPSVGKVGQAMARMIEESEIETEELYVKPEGETQLAGLQQAFLELAPPPVMPVDGSIELHLATTPHREVEVLADWIAESGYRPRDVIVMAPQIAGYAPFIESVFGGRIPYQIADMPAAEAAPEVVGLLQLVDLDWSREGVLALFAHPLFREVQGWSEEEVLQIGGWAREVRIEREWEEGIDRLIHRLVAEEERPIDWTLAPLLGELGLCVRALREAVRLGGERTLTEWGEWLQGWAVRFLGTEVAQLRQLKGERRYGFRFVRQLLDVVLGGESVSVHKNQVEAVRFCSLLPMRAIPAKVIVLLGMEEEAFPRRDRGGGLDLLKEEGAGFFCPDRRAFDRSLFLEALLSARERLYLSASDEALSLLVHELLGVVGEVKRVEHAPYPLVEVEREIVREELPHVAVRRGKVIHLSELVRLARTPLKVYYRAAHGIGFPFEAVEPEEFVISPFERARLQREALVKPLERVLGRAVLPKGAFGEVAERRLRKELVEGEAFEVGPLKVGDVVVSGVVDGMTDEGLVVPEKRGMRGVARVWPQFVLANCVKPTALHFGKGGKPLEWTFGDPLEALRAYVDYYGASLGKPSYLYPELVEPLLKGEVKGFDRIFDPAFEWAVRAGRVPTGEELVVGWGRKVHELFGGVYEAL